MNPRKIIIAPDSFKETLSAGNAAEAIRRGFMEIFPDAEYVLLPVADGGEGTAEALIKGTRGRKVRKTVTGPLGEKIRAHYGLLGDGITAAVEMAAASGLDLVPEAKRNPLETHTYGTGEMIADAIHRGARRIVFGIGGSATVDGGTGMGRALGIRYLDKGGKELDGGGAILGRIADIDISDLLPGLADTRIQIACDVTNPLLGREGATRVYGPQKGASPEQVEKLETGMTSYIEVLERVCGRALREIPGTGAVGGLGLPLIAFCDAVNTAGIELVLDVLQFEPQLDGADLIITGEGKMDGQSVFGKAPIGVARLGAERGIPVIAINGCIGDDIENVLQHGISAYYSTITEALPLEELKKEAGPRLADAAAGAARDVKAGKV